MGTPVDLDKHTGASLSCSACVCVWITFISEIFEVTDGSKCFSLLMHTFQITGRCIFVWLTWSPILWYFLCPVISDCNVIGTVRPIAWLVHACTCVCVCVYKGCAHVPHWDSNPMKPFLSAGLCCAFTFRPASYPAVTARLAEGLLFFVPVCVLLCACTLCLSMSVQILHPRIPGSHVIPGNPPSESV